MGRIGTRLNRIMRETDKVRLRGFVVDIAASHFVEHQPPGTLYPSVVLGAFNPISVETDISSARAVFAFATSPQSL